MRWRRGYGLFFTTPVVFWIIVINFILLMASSLFDVLGIDLIKGYGSNALEDLFALTPVLAFNGFFWQFITYMFLHAGFWHFFLNMFTLLMFGPQIEMEVGSKKFLAYYLLCGIGSAIFHVLLTGISFVPMVGASGAIFGILVAFALLFPNATIFVMGLFPMPAISAVFVFGLMEFMYGLASPYSPIAHWGHLGGMITGLLLMKSGFLKKREWYWVWE